MLKFFCIPARQAAGAEGELNRLLRTQRIVSVDRRWVENGEQSFWSVCVEYTEPVGPVPAAPASSGEPGKGKIDYRERLKPEDFAVYAQLRELRKAVAAEESVPVYAVFTNDHLAQIAEGKVRTKAALEAIQGVGAARAEKYADRFLSLLNSLDTQPPQKGT